MNQSHQTDINGDSFSFVKFDRLKEIAENIVYPCLCFFGLSTNMINVYIFSRRDKLKNKIYRYFLLNSTIELVYMSGLLVNYILRWKIFGHIHYSYWHQAFRLYVYWILTSYCALMMNFVELIISVKRYLLISNRSIAFRVKSKIIVLSCALMCALMMLPLILTRRIVDQRYCRISFENYKCSNHSQRRMYAIVEISGPLMNLVRDFHLHLLFRGLIAPLLLLIVSIAIIIKFRQIFQRKTALLNNSIPHSNHREGEYKSRHFNA